ncbi:MAG: hypothetical protein ACT4P0_05940 [Panacagrimonas sp.]
MSITRFATTCLGVAVLSACGGIGDGSKPEEIRIVAVSATTGLSGRDFVKLFDAPQKPVSTYTCLRDRMAAFVRFSDGDIGDFTRRVNWTSDNPAVATVSNGDEPVPGLDKRFFVPGSFKPVSASTVNITAEYLGVTTTIPVTVREIDKSSIELTPTTAAVAPRALQTFQVFAMIDGVRTALTGTRSRFLDAFNFKFQAPNEEIVLIDGTDAEGVQVLGVAVPEAGAAPMVLDANLTSECPGVTLTAPVQVADVTSLKLGYEEGFPNGRLITGSTQVVRVIGSYAGVDLDGNGEDDTQDLSEQCTFESSNPVAVVPGSIFSGFNRLVALAGTSTTQPARVGSAKLVATYGAIPDPDGEGPEVEDPGLKSNELDFSVVNVVVDALEIGPRDAATPTPVTIAPRGSTQFKAVGTYTFDGHVRTIDLSRHVIWEVTEVDGVPIVKGDEPVVAISTGGNKTAGLAQSVVGVDDADQESVVTIQARLVRGVNDTGRSVPPDDLEDLVETTTLTVEQP